jgi:signal recognition particle subunit SRP72
MTQTIQNLAALLQRTAVDDHDEIIKACNAILKKSKHDLGTQYVKVVALLKCDRFEDAIRVIEDGGDALKNKASLEWSYALYKVGKLDEAIAAAAAAASDGRGRGARHVEAQAVC